MTDVVEAVRRFNRSYTQRIGVLEDSFLGLGMPLGPARLLYEAGRAPVTTHGLRERLGLDSGYLSRLLRRLEQDGLVRVAPDPGDRRRRRVLLTDPGRERWQELERRSDDQARLIVGPLTARQRERLARALAEADLLVRAATVRFAPASPASRVGRDVTGRYFAEIGRRFGFEADGETERDARLLVPPQGLFVVAVSDGDPVACGGLHEIGPGVGELKRMWVHGDWRGAGLGSRLLRHLEAAARALGHATVRLDTNAALTEAIGMYERAGYRAIGRYNDNPWATHFFEKTLISPRDPLVNSNPLPLDLTPHPLTGTKPHLWRHHMPTSSDGRWDIPHPRVAAAVRGGTPDDAERLARVAGLQPERMADSLAFLAGYAPGVLDAILTATEACLDDLFPADGDALEPYCTACGAKAGVFIAHGPDWRHYAGDPAKRTARPFEADHAPVIGWRPATDHPAFVAF